MSKIMKYSIYMVFLNLLTGCVLLFPNLYGYDFSPEGRHKEWVEFYNGFIGTNIYEIFKINNSLMNQSAEIILPNGYRKTPSVSPLSSDFGCTSWFIYDPKTGIIVDFSFEEKKKYACRYYGAP